MTILKDLVEKEKYEKDNDKKYAEQLRLVADELIRAAQQIENPHADEIKYYHEDNEGSTTDHFEATKAKMEHITNLKHLNFKENSIASNVNMIKRAIQTEAEEKFLQR